MCESVFFKGGKLNGTTGAICMGARTVVQDGETYYRTYEYDSKGRAVFKYRQA